MSVTIYPEAREQAKEEFLLRYEILNIAGNPLHACITAEILFRRNISCKL